jgi:predicted DNA-binding antitoxin AbrB/MazE fold protein
MTVRAIFEDGVFRPLEPVDLPEHSAVEFEPRPVSDPDDRRAARARLRRHVVSLGHATGIDNPQIDADLAREAGNPHDPHPAAPPP